MREHFKSEYDAVDALYAHADSLRPTFGQWDAADPVAHAILAVVEAQNELSDLFAEDDYVLNCEAAYKAAVDKRHAAGRRLWAALTDRSSWPDPDLGRPL